MMVQVRKRHPAGPAQAANTEKPIDGLLDAGVFKALSDPTRLRLLACLAKCGRPCSVGELAQCCSVDLSVVSRHLAALADAGLLESSKSGRTVSYRVRFGAVADMFRSLGDALADCCPGGCRGGACECGCNGSRSGRSRSAGKC
jgi:DNA-binding transcriptional ArsR family regulator